MLLDVNDEAITRRQRAVSTKVQPVITTDGTPLGRSLRQVRRRLRRMALRRALGVLGAVVGLGFAAGAGIATADPGQPDSPTPAVMTPAASEEETSVPDTTTTTEDQATTTTAPAEEMPLAEPVPVVDVPAPVTETVAQPVETTEAPAVTTTVTPDVETPTTTVEADPAAELPDGFCSEPDAIMLPLGGGGWRCVPPGAEPYEWRP